MDVLALLAAAHPATQDAVPFRWHSGWSNDQMLAASSVVLVGKIQSIEFVGAIVNGTDDHGYSGAWQFMKASVTIENLLKGSVPGRVASFCFYTTSGPTMGDTNNIKIGDRYVLFLVSDAGVLRAVRDLWRSGIEVGTGSHALGLEPSGSIQETISTLLLTAGADLNPKTFERAIIRSVPFADEWLDHCRVTRLLTVLTQFPNAVVQNAASEQLAIRDACASVK